MLKLATVIAILIAGICIWFIACLIGIIVAAPTKFIWTCVSGMVLGLIGIRYTVRRAKRSGI